MGRWKRFYRLIMANHDFFQVVLTGAKVRQEIYEAFDNIYPILKNFKKQ